MHIIVGKRKKKTKQKQRLREMAVLGLYVFLFCIPRHSFRFSFFIDHIKKEKKNKGK